MLTVSISINGEPIYARTVVNQNATGDECVYRSDDGTLIKHSRKAGAVKLAIKVLKTIKEA